MANIPFGPILFNDSMNPPDGVYLMFKRTTYLWLVVSSIGLITLLSLTLVTDDADSSSGGITGKTEPGCTCHSPDRSGDVVPKIDGLPSSYEPGKVYDLALSFTGPSPSGSADLAGFNIKVDGGTLASPGSPSVRIGTDGSEATHSSTGIVDKTWQVQWTAPDRDEGDIDVTLVVNVVNGDGSPGPADKWGRTRVTVEGEGGGGGISGTMMGAILLVLLLVVGMVVFMFKRPRTNPKKRPRRPGGKRRNRRK
jgi:hypothetical protein